MNQYIYGKNAVKQALKKNSVTKVLLSASNQDFIQLLKSKNIPYEICDKKVLDKLSQFGVHQGVVASIKAYPTYDLKDIIKEKGLIVLLDGIEDPHNLGAILRTCDACGVDGVIIGKNRSVGLNATVAKVSTGAIYTVKVCEVVNLTQTIETLKKHGYWVIGTDTHHAKDYRQIQADVGLVIVIGNEGKGISSLVKKHCDYMVHIPMLGSVESLNASVSTGVLLYNILNLRNPLK